MRSRRLPEHEKMARKAGAASFVGTTIEWYDFYIYGTASALVFGPLFFSPAPAEVGVLISFATFWVAFVARPLGGILFGHLGDRVGRKNTLITTLVLMGVATLGIGLLPTYADVGWVAPVLLILLRLLQGLAVGGEWGGAVLIASEHAQSHRSILFGAFAQQGSPAGRILASLAFLLVSQAPRDVFLEWGWRIPFLASALLVVVGLVIRLKIEESPAMAELKATKRTARLPVLEVLKRHWRLVLLGVCASAMAFSAAYLKDTFVLSWGTSDLGFARDTLLMIIVITSVVQFVVQPFGAVLASRWDVRRAVTLFLLLELPAMPLMFFLVSTGNVAWALLGMAIATVPQVMYYAVLAGLLAQAFPARIRYTAISLSYQLAGVLLGMTPFLGQSLLNAFDSIIPVILFAVATVLISLLGTRALSARPVGTDETSPSRDVASTSRS